MSKIKARAVSLLAMLLVLLGGAIGVGSTPAVASMPATPVSKPMPALDYAHATVGKFGSVRKGKFTAPMKIAPKSPCGTCYFYGGGQQTVVTDGASDQATVEKPSCTGTYCYHSLFELALMTTNGQQIVEWGWTVDPSVFGNSNPHLFAASWTNGSFNGYGTGFVPAVGTTCPHGLDVNGDVTAGSATTRLFGVQYVSGAWWTSYKGNYCGAFQNSLWTSPTFTQAGKVQLFGEVAANDTAPTGVGMGSGVLGSTTAGAKSYSFGLGNTVPAGVTPSLGIFNNPSVPTHYNAVMIAPTVFRSFRYGGTY